MLHIAVSFLSMIMFVSMPVSLLSMDRERNGTDAPPAQDASDVYEPKYLRIMRDGRVQKSQLNRERLCTTLAEALSAFVHISLCEHFLVGHFISERSDVMQHVSQLVTSCVDQIMGDITRNQLHHRCSWYRAGCKIGAASSHPLVGQHLMFTIACYVSVVSKEDDPEHWHVDVRWASVERFNRTFDLDVVPGGMDAVRALF